MEDIDIRQIFKKLSAKWYWFLFAFMLAISFAFMYLKVTPKKYAVSTSIQLKDKSVGDKGTSTTQEKFISGYEIPENDAAVEDEIGILMAHSTIRQCVEHLGFNVSYYESPEFLGAAGKFLGQQIYPAPFTVKPVSARWQLIDVPVYIEFVGEGKVRVKAECNKEHRLHQFLTSKSVSEKAKLKLDTIVSLKQPIVTEWLNFSVEADSAANFDDQKSFYIVMNSYDDVADYYKKTLMHEQDSEKSSIVRLNMVSSVPQKDIFLLKELTQIYIANDMAKKAILGKKTLEFIDLQLKSVKDSLGSTERNLKSFRQQNQVVDVATTSQNLTEQLFELEERQAQLNIQGKYYQYMADYLKRYDDVSDLKAPSSVGDENLFLNSLLVQLSKLNEEKIALGHSSSDKNPLMVVLNEKIASLKKALLDNIESLSSSNSIAVAENSRRIESIKKSQAELPANEQNLTDINRRFTFNDNIYNYLIQKRAETGIKLASNTPDKTVIDPPRQQGSRPVAPNSIFIYLIAAILGMLIPLLVFFARDYFAPAKLENSSQLGKWSPNIVLETIPLIRGRDTDRLESYLTDSFRYLRQHVSSLERNHQVQSIAVTSAKSQEGKTFCTKHLSISLARSGKKVIVIDADMHHPKLADEFNVSNETGLSDYLNNPAEHVIQSTAYDGLDIISSGSPIDNSSDLLTTNQIQKLVTKLKRVYDFILFDTPPVGVISDYLSIGESVDYTIVVVRHGFTSKVEVERLNKILFDNDIRAGIVYNASKGKDNLMSYNGYLKKLKN